MSDGSDIPIPGDGINKICITGNIYFFFVHLIYKINKII